MQIYKSVKIVRRPDKILLYFSDKGDLFQINEIGAFIVDRVKKGKEEEEIVLELEQETHEKRDTIKKDIQKFFKILREKGIME